MSSTSPCLRLQTGALTDPRHHDDPPRFGTVGTTYLDGTSAPRFGTGGCGTPGRCLLSERVPTEGRTLRPCLRASGVREPRGFPPFEKQEGSPKTSYVSGVQRRHSGASRLKFFASSTTTSRLRHHERRRLRGSFRQKIKDHSCQEIV